MLVATLVPTRGPVVWGRGLLTVGLTVVEVAAATRALCAFTLVGVGGFRIRKVAGATLILDGCPGAQTAGAKLTALDSLKT